MAAWGVTCERHPPASIVAHVDSTTRHRTGNASIRWTSLSKRSRLVPMQESMSPRDFLSTAMMLSSPTTL